MSESDCHSVKYLKRCSANTDSASAFVSQKCLAGAGWDVVEPVKIFLSSSWIIILKFGCCASYSVGTCMNDILLTYLLTYSDRGQQTVQCVKTLNSSRG